MTDTPLLRHPDLMISHPAIQWPRVTKPKKEGDVSTSPDRRCAENTAALLDAYGISVCYDLMRHALDVRIPGYERDAERRQNAGLARLHELAERRGLSGQTVMDHLQFLAREHHPVRDWIGSAPWDGEDRRRQMHDTLLLQQGSDVDLCRSLLDRWMTACVAAILPTTPGARPFTPQGALVFQGGQGIGKTEWFKALAPPGEDWISVGRTLDPHSRDSVQQATSYWIVELGELDATYRRADVAALKAWITQPVDVYRAAYARREERIPRRTMMGASVNARYYLIDDTGNRRWWTIPVAALDWRHTVDMQQLWAQIEHEIQAGARWWLDAEEQQRLDEAHETHLVIDPVVSDMWAAWEAVPVVDADRPPRIAMDEIWEAMQGRDRRPRTRAEAIAMANALRSAGVENTTLTHGARTYRVRRLKDAAPSSWSSRDDAGWAD